VAPVSDEYPYGLRIAVMKGELGVAKTCFASLLETDSLEDIRELLIDIALDSGYYLIGEMPSELSDKKLWAFTKKLTLCPTNRDPAALFFIQTYLADGDVKALQHLELLAAQQMYRKGITWTAGQLERNLENPSRKLSKYERNILETLQEWAAVTGEMNYRFLAALVFMLIIKRGLPWKKVRACIEKSCKSVKAKKEDLPWWTISPTSQKGLVVRSVLSKQFKLSHQQILILWLLFQCDWGRHIDEKKLTFKDQVWWNPYAMLALQRTFKKPGEITKLWKGEIEPCLGGIVIDLRS
jgi:hypothetical protein